MLKALVKKQLQEMFRSYFVNPKTGKARSKGQIIRYFILFAFLMAFLCCAFFALGANLCLGLSKAGFLWLYFAIMGILATLLGVFGSVFNTYASLYVAKDNEQLLALPIPPSKLLAARLISVFLLSVLYGDCVWLPTILCPILMGVSTLSSIFQSSLMLLVLPILITTITCILGWLVAELSTKLKNKSILMTIIAVVFFVLYYFFCFRMSDIMAFLLDRSTEVAGYMKIWGYLFYLLGMGAEGHLLQGILFTLVSAGTFAICFLVLSKSFYHILTRNTATKKVAYKEKKTTVNSVKKALVQKEWKRFTSSPTYMLNCGFGVLMMVALPVLTILKRSALLEVVESMENYRRLLPLFLTLTYFLLCGTDIISAPAISLEGKNLWILRSLPIEAKDILEAKGRIHVMVNLYPAAISVTVVSMVLGLEVVENLMMLILLYLYIQISSELGLVIGILRPNFNWISEVTVIKQSLNSFILLVFDWISAFLTLGLYYFVRNLFSVTSYMVLVAVLYLLLHRLLKHWLNTKGAALFQQL